MITKEQWSERVLKTVSSFSRTIHGISDTSSATEKPKLTVKEGKQLIDRTSRNLLQAIEYLWVNRSISFITSLEVQDFIDSLAMIISDGLLQQGQSLYRTWDTQYGQTHPSEISEQYHEFCKWFLSTMDSHDPAATAAIVEKRLNGEIHPFSDGCGRTSMLLAAFVLLRHDINPAVYHSRKEYFELIGKSNDEEWIRYYRSLLP
ncbi:MAG: Fic/DOC family protein [Methanoregula sp. PtaU1.Bin051]|nr:MAG: Fic/DOC family protein [Methanoregula sp. PtaU1.Bin051]